MKHGDLKDLDQFSSLVVKNVLSLNHLVQTKFLGSTVNPEMSIVGSSAIVKAKYVVMKHYEVEM